MKKRIISLAIMGMLCLTSLTVTSVAASADTLKDNEPISLYVENEDVLVEQDSITFSAELVLDSTETREVVVAGFFNTTIYIDNNNRNGEIWWTVNLGTGDLVKSVTGTVIVKRDWFGPINPILDTVYVNYINYGTQFSTANDIVEYDLGSTYDDSDNFIFQFKDFQIQGVQEHYTVGYREVQKEIRDLERF